MRLGQVSAGGHCAAALAALGFTEGRGYSLGAARGFPLSPSKVEEEARATIMDTAEIKKSVAAAGRTRTRNSHAPRWLARLAAARCECSRAVTLVRDVSHMARLRGCLAYPRGGGHGGQVVAEARYVLRAPRPR